MSGRCKGQIMGMAVKGATQHRLVRRGMQTLLESTADRDSDLTEHEREGAITLLRRADLALDRLKRRKLARAARSFVEQGGATGWPPNI